MRNGIDREVRPHLEGAKRALRAAVGVCSKVTDPKERRKAEDLRRRATAALKMLGGSGRVSFYSNDPDLFPEDQKYPGWHKRDRRDNG
jgi:hypothetical protein